RKIPIDIDADHAWQHSRQYRSIRITFRRNHHDTSRGSSFNHAFEYVQMIEIWTTQTQIHYIHLMLDRPFDGLNKPGRARSQRMTKQLQNVIIRVRGLFLNSRRDGCSMAKQVFARSFVVFRIKLNRMCRRANMRMTDVDAGIDHSYFETVA